MNDLIPVENIDALLDKYEQENGGLPKWQVLKTPIWLDMSIEELRKKSPDELTEATIELNRYIFSLDRLIGRQRAWKRWGESKLNEYTSENLPKIGDNYGWNERMLMARTLPEECKKIQRFLREIDMKLERLYQTPQNVKAICDSIKDMKFAQIRKEKQYEKE